MPRLLAQQVEEYLTMQLAKNVKVLALVPLTDRKVTSAEMPIAHEVTAKQQRENEAEQVAGNMPKGNALKTFGYGDSLLIRFSDPDGKEGKIVFRTAKRNQFDHEYRSDRAADLLASYDRFNTLPRHAQALDVGFLTKDQQMISASNAEEYFLLTEYAEGKPYADDLQRIRDSGESTRLDLARAEALAIYLAGIHSEKRCAPDLYRRHLRDVFGSGEGIAGLLDSYADDNNQFNADQLRQIELACTNWRWKVKANCERLARVHGDFHPFNVLFNEGTDFQLLDRSRSPWGEPADDVCCMAINYLFFSLQSAGEMAAPFLALWQTFWRTYLHQSQDRELLNLAMPFLVWRALVLANPIWYDISNPVRQKLFNFIQNLLQINTFDPDRINDYLLIGGIP